jgi:hypothetical protein
MIKKAILFIVLIFLSFFSYFSYAGDALDDAFSGSKDYQIVSKNIDSWKVSWWVQKTAKLMLKISIMVWLAVFLYGWIRFFLSMWDDWKAKKVRDSLITAWIWLIIAFWAWGILQVIISIWTTLSTGQ